MKNLSILLALIAVLITVNQVCAQPQPPDTLWTKTYGGIDNDWGRCVQQTTDGGYIIVGDTYSYGSGVRDIYLIKTDSLGNEEWFQTFNGSDSDCGYGVKQTIDEGYIIVGTMNVSAPPASEIMLIKTNFFGIEEWRRNFIEEETAVSQDIQLTDDGGYIIAGWSESYSGEQDFYLVKTDIFGDSIWTRTYDGGGSDCGRSVQQTIDGGYIVVGETYSYSPQYNVNVSLIKTDSLGNEEWCKVFGGEENDAGHCVKQTTNGGYIIAGRTESFSSNDHHDVYLIKTDSLGNEEWYKTFGGIEYEEAYSIDIASDGGYIIVGRSNSFSSGDYDIYIIKTDSLGNEEWYQTHGATNSDWGSSVQLTDDAGYIVAGWTDSFGFGGNDVWLLKIAPDVPVIQIEPNICAFGILEVGYPENMQIEMTNEGYGELIISEFLINPPFSCQIISGDSTLSYGDTTTIEITFDPPEVGYYIDSLGIVSNASNEDTAWVHLEGEGGIIPAPVTGLTIEIIGSDAVLTWNPVDTTIHGNPITVDTYIIFYSEIPYAPDSLYFYLWNTPDTTFTHIDAAFFADLMFYEVVAFVGEIGELDFNPAFRMSDFKAVLKDNFR